MLFRSHAHSSFWGGISAAYISAKYNIPLVITEHSSLKYAKYVKKSYEKYIFDSYKAADCLITVGTGLKEEINSYVDREIKVIPNMVDLNLFNMDMEHCDTANNNTFKFFSCAFLEEGKGMEYLIRAFARVFRDEDVSLRIGGDGSTREFLENLSKELQIDKKITFLGALSREEVSKEMKKCDAFALPSEHETFGVVYIEALACGKPVIGAYNGGAEDIINEKNGIIALKNNVQDLGNSLKWIRNNYSDYDKLKIREEVVKKYSENVLIEKLKGVYKEVNEKFI